MGSDNQNSVSTNDALQNKYLSIAKASSQNPEQQMEASKMPLQKMHNANSSCFQPKKWANTNALWSQISTIKSR